MAKAKRKKALVICNGELLQGPRLRALAEDADIIACADGGANQAKKYGIFPDMIVGDLDSIEKKAKNYFRKVKMICNTNDDQTDLEKVLDVLLAKGVNEVTVVGATGRRTDHTITNFSILKKYHRKCTLRYLDAHCEISLVDRATKFSGRKGELISLAPLGKVEGITTRGLKYRLRNEALDVGVREGQSNVIVSNPVEISVKRGTLLLFRIHSLQRARLSRPRQSVRGQAGPVSRVSGGASSC
ncbi:MAG: thiamine diphosphokinase [Bacteroidota bacterium]